MDSKSLWLGVAEVLVLLKEYSEKHKPPRPSATKLERRSGWAVFIGALMYLSGEALRQLGDHAVPSLGLTYVVLSLLGLLAFLVAAVGILVDFVRTTRRPFVEHLDGIIGALDRECELIGALLRFETVTLELASERLSLQSTKVASRVGMIGGGEGLKTSLVGVVAVAFALFSQYVLVVQGSMMKSLAFIGLALLLGLSIGGMLVRYGASEAEYHRGLIKIALDLKAHNASKVRETFSRRMGRGGREDD